MTKASETMASTRSGRWVVQQGGPEGYSAFLPAPLPPDPPVVMGAELNRRGYRVMTVKHGHGFQLDQPGRDSWRHRHEGGALRTVLASPSSFGVVGSWPQEEMPLSELVERFLWDADIVLAEGFKAASQPTIEVFRGASGSRPLFDPGGDESQGTLALVTDRPGLQAPFPVFDMNDPGFLAQLTNLVVKRFLSDEGRP